MPLPVAKTIWQGIVGTRTRVRVSSSIELQYHAPLFWSSQNHCAEFKYLTVSMRKYLASSFVIHTNMIATFMESKCLK